jgi:hypothetical protein
MWMRCAVGQTWAQGTCAGVPATLTWQAALDAAQAINKRGNFFFNDWRLPQVPELAGIAERQCKNPRINLTVFPATPSVAFWTATSRPSTTVEAFAFVLGFGADGVKYVSKDETHDVRLTAAPMSGRPRPAGVRRCASWARRSWPPAFFRGRSRARVRTLRSRSAQGRSRAH